MTTITTTTTVAMTTDASTEERLARLAARSRARSAADAPAAAPAADAPAADAPDLPSSPEAPSAPRARRRGPPARSAKIVTVGASTSAMLGMMAAFAIADGPPPAPLVSSTVPVLAESAAPPPPRSIIVAAPVPVVLDVPVPGDPGPARWRGAFRPTRPAHHRCPRRRAGSRAPAACARTSGHELGKLT
ncbi:MAG TPA: hypothetical protein VFD53_00545 [Ilumatobacter sp.]|nr:hypothetical protein [Ilumatobacter sp.]